MIISRLSEYLIQDKITYHYYFNCLDTTHYVANQVGHLIIKALKQGLFHIY